VWTRTRFVGQHAAAKFVAVLGLTRPMVERKRALVPTSKYRSHNSAGTEAANLRKGSRCLMKMLRFFGGIGVER